MTAISTDKAPAAIGPYSQARVAGGLLFVSGQLPIIAAIAEAACTELSKTVKTTILLTDLFLFRSHQRSLWRVLCLAVSGARDVRDLGPAAWRQGRGGSRHRARIGWPR